MAGMRHSILNRLIDSPGTAPRRDGQASPAELAEAIRVDVENLLNTRNHLDEELRTENSPAAGTIVGYGLGDLEGVLLGSAADADALRGRIKRIIESFEPRLRKVDVKVLLAPRPYTQEIVLEIRGTIRVDEYQELVAWNSVLQGGTARLTRM